MREILLLLNKYFYSKPTELRKILEGFQKIEDTLEAPKDAFFKLGIQGKAFDEFIKSRSEEILKLKFQEDINVVTILDNNYPEKLKNIYDAPPIFFYKGDISCFNKKCLAVVGSRKMSSYGQRAVSRIVKDLCRDFTIISGLAYGVDGFSHQITVDNNEKTVAILGSGLQKIYPSANVGLAEKIIFCGGAIISEYPPNADPQKFHFPMRNRIIAGLSDGILIIEGGKKSGTLITAKLGVDFGADIFAIPNGIFEPNSEGVNYLIKCGAHLVTDAKDILEFYGVESNIQKTEFKPTNDWQKNILEVLINGPKTVDEIAGLTRIGLTDLMGELIDLELLEAIKVIEGKKYIKI